MTELSKLIGTILKHDRKTTSYKIALVRSLNDLVLGFPLLGDSGSDVAVPIRMLAELWVAYYWPFADPDAPVEQGYGALGKQDIAFRAGLTSVHKHWAALVGVSRPSDGFFLVNELRVPRRRATYPTDLISTFEQVVNQITRAIAYPIQYAGPGEWSVFSRPRPLSRSTREMAIPGSRPNESCLTISSKLWNTFRDLSLWIEALCIHEWSLYTESVSNVSRGQAYTLLTDRPDNRRPLHWERNHVELLMMEGEEFVCPWTGRRLSEATYDLDHMVPVSVYPLNEMWNLVPADRLFNQRIKRDRLPSTQRLEQASSVIAKTYESYGQSPDLRSALWDDLALRFSMHVTDCTTSESMADSAVRFLAAVRESRNVATF